MSEYNSIKEQLKDLKEFINIRFNKNDEEHIRVNNHLAKLNGQVAKNTKFRQENCHELETLIGNRERNVRIIFDIFWKVLLIGALIMFGLQQYTGNVL